MQEVPVEIAPEKTEGDKVEGDKVEGDKVVEPSEDDQDSGEKE